MDRVVVEDVWPLPHLLPWEILLPPIDELIWVYSWIDCFTRSSMSGSILFVRFLLVWNLSTWYMGEFGAPPTLKRGIDPTCCLSYGLFVYTKTHSRGLPVVIIWVSWSGKWRLFMIHPVRMVIIIKFSSWCH